MYSCVCALPEHQAWKHYLKNNHLSTLSNSFSSFCKRDKLTQPQAFLNRHHFSSLIVCCRSALVRSDVCTADFGTTLITFSPREKPNCVILDLSRPLLHRYEPCWLFPSLGCSGETFGKDVSPLWFPLASVAILSLPLLLPLFFLALSLLMPRFHFSFFSLCKLILLMWCESHEFSHSPLGILAWPSRFFMTYIKLSASAVHHPGCLHSLVHLSLSLFLG